jgi:hypothetical protein
MSDRLKKFLNCPHRHVQQFTEVCLDCGENIYTSAREIMQQEAREESRKHDQDKWNENGW